MAKAKTVTKKFVKPTVKSFDTIIRPVITEKTMSLMQNQNKVTVEVAKNANRAAVKIAFEGIFNVKVESVNIINTLRKSKRAGRYEGYVPGMKKAIVTLAEGEELDLFKE